MSTEYVCANLLTCDATACFMWCEYTVLTKLASMNEKRIKSMSISLSRQKLGNIIGSLDECKKKSRCKCDLSTPSKHDHEIVPKISLDPDVMASRREKLRIPLKQRILPFIAEPRKEALAVHESTLTTEHVMSWFGRVVHSSGFKQDLTEPDDFPGLLKTKAPESRRITKREIIPKTKSWNADNISRRKGRLRTLVSNLAPCLSEKQSFYMICTRWSFFKHATQT